MKELLYQLAVLLIMFLAICWMVKPFRPIPGFLLNSVGKLIKIVVDIVISIFQQLILFLQEALPMVINKLLQAVLAILLAIVRAISWLLEKLIQGCYLLFQSMRK